MFIMISVSLSKSHLFCIKGRFKYYIILKIFSTIKKCFEDNAILYSYDFPPVGSALRLTKCLKSPIGLRVKFAFVGVQR